MQGTAVNMIDLVIPLTPPSANHYKVPTRRELADGRRFFKYTPETKAWFDAIALFVRHRQMAGEEHAVWYKVYRGRGERGDISSPRTHQLRRRTHPLHRLHHPCPARPPQVQGHHLQRRVRHQAEEQHSRPPGLTRVPVLSQALHARGPRRLLALSQTRRQAPGPSLPAGVRGVAARPRRVPWRGCGESRRRFR